MKTRDQTAEAIKTLTEVVRRASSRQEEALNKLTAAVVRLCEAWEAGEDEGDDGDGEADDDDDHDVLEGRPIIPIEGWVSGPEAPSEAPDETREPKKGD